MFYHIFITGCQYNYYDAKNIAHLMQRMGYVYVNDDKKVDVIIALACSVRQKPMDRIFGKLKRWQALPQKPKIIITGCILPADKKKLVDRVDVIIETEDLEKELPKLLHCYIATLFKKQKKQFSNLTIRQYNTSAHSLTKCKSRSGDFHPLDIDEDTALIPIMQGCNNFCTYCAVPYVRGPEKSRPANDIVAEIKKELLGGKKHILLLGQNVNKYSAKLKVQSGKQQLKAQNINSENQFVELLKKIDKLPGKFTFNFLSANPRNFSQELIKILPKLKKWQHILHLPLQAGDDEILAKMNRKYKSKQYLKIITSVQRLVSNISFTTDLLVGFPGETKKQFENTVNLCKKIGFAKAYVNQYSPRPGTFAARNLEDDVSAEEKKRRWKVLNNLINKKSEN